MTVSAQQLVQALGGKWHGLYGKCRCPAHSDNNPSLSISEDNDGKLLWHCHTGCSQQDVFDALTKLGLIQTAQVVRERKKKTKSGPLVATYEYRDPSGNLQFQVLKYRSKEFRQRRPDGRDGWVWNLAGIEKLPYRLPEFLNHKLDTIFIAEGEKDVESLRRFGVVATCNPGGAGKWRRNYNQYFNGRDIIVLPDNDSVGQKHAEQISVELSAVASRIRILELPGLPPHGDVSDWIEAGGTLDDLLTLVDQVDDFTGFGPNKSRDWYGRCQAGAKGQVLSTHSNVMLALRNDPAWQRAFYFDEMLQKIMLLHPVPVHGEQNLTTFERARPWGDTDDSAAQEWMQIAGLPHVTRDTVASAISQRASELKTDPLREWLNNLQWDGIPRLNGGTSEHGDILQPWLTTYLGVSENIYTRAVGMMWLVSAVARVISPGCKADHTLLLEGDQGTGKSTACRILASDEYFSDTLNSIGSKDAMAHLSGKWIIEIAELDAIIRSDPATVKAFLTQQVDKFRPPYGRREVERPRRSIFVGTTNHKIYLKDETGGRRYWPVATGDIDLIRLRCDRNQLWAEAVHLFELGQPWHITDAEVLEFARVEQDNRYDADVWEGPITEYLQDKSEIFIGIIMGEALNIDISLRNRSGQLRVMNILSRLGWCAGPRRSKGRLWVRNVAPE